jgi:flagellar biosynthesis/type III secretory pathway chaperone
VQLSFDQQQQLSRLLTAELEAGQQLLGILKEEYKTLSKRDPEQITKLSEAKLKQLQTFEGQLSQRHRFFVGLGLSPEREALEQLFQSPACDTAVINQWQELQQLADSLQRQNEINGGIVALSQRNVAMALDVLTGKDKTTPTYGPSGKASNGQPSSRLAKA